MQIDPKAPVLVTGGTGYIASWIVRKLLERGCTVHATARSKKKAANLEKLAEGTQGKLTIFEADLLSPGSFDEGMKGCELVMHTASPFVITGVQDPESELVKPAVEGTRNVLESVDRTPSVKRVVLTSSVAAIYGDNADVADAPGGVLTEAQWNTSSSVGHNPYPYSKVAAEREAQRLCRAQDRWDLVVINPSLVLGPSFTNDTRSGSVKLLLDFGKGKLRTGVPDLELGAVDVRDVAQAHIEAGFRPDAEGRHILSAQVLSMIGIARILRRSFPGYPLPPMQVPKVVAWLVAPLSGYSRKYISRNVGHPLRLDNSKSKQALGIEYRPVEETLREHFQQLIDDGVLPAKG